MVIETTVGGYGLLLFVSCFTGFFYDGTETGLLMALGEKVKSEGKRTQRRHLMGGDTSSRHKERRREVGVHRRALLFKGRKGLDL